MEAKNHLAQKIDSAGLELKSKEVKIYGHNLFNIKHPIIVMTEGVWQPATDVIETEDKFIVIMDIAGISADNMNVTYKGGYLIIKGFRDDPVPQEKIKGYHKKEIDSGYFERSIKLNSRIQRDNIDAKYENGFLKITLIKDLSKSEHIEVNVK
jgi:HSP20 family protein